MNFDEAIKAHSDWKMKLNRYLNKPDGSLKSAEIEPDNKCALGKWIYGEGAQLSAIGEYSDLRDAHSRFHKAAAEVVKKADRGEWVAAEVALGSKSAFGTASSQVVMTIMKMKQKSGQ